MLVMLRRAVGRELRRRGLYRLGPEPFGVTNRELLLRRHGITLVIDAGANVGQYGSQLRYIGYTGRILSFEPSSDAHATLMEVTQNDPLWDVENVAVGDEDRERAFNIANSTVCNSLLPMGAQYQEHVPGTTVIRQEIVTIRRLDGYLDAVRADDRLWVKLDVEGNELAAIAGATQLIGRAAVVEVEMATEQLLEDEPLFFDVAPALYRLGLKLISVSTAYQSPSGRTLKFDGAFAR